MRETGDETGRAAPERRGEAAYRAHLERVNARNAEARKAGKQQREQKERLAQAERHALERRMDDELARSFAARSR
jgi:hypothetical protein